jgi:cyclopropane fatty-acyl-phospholipid synthase-like methyltransferase
MSYPSWNDRYAEPGFAYGTEPNDFLKSVVAQIPHGRVLSLGEGEGRNAIYLATHGLDVTAVDASEVGLAKARQLAADRKVEICTITADLAAFTIESQHWDGIISIFCHLTKAVRAPLYQAAVKGLKPGGIFILQAFTPEQLKHRTGGPTTADRLASLSELQQELSGLEFTHALEIERNIMEGKYHSGLSSVAQIVGRKPLR